MKKISALLILLTLIIALLTPAAHGRAQGREKRVLLLNSYHYGLSWTDNLVRGVRSVLDPNTPDLQLYVEYMDTKRFGAGYYEELKAVYAAKYKDTSLDVIIASDNDAFNFMAKYHDELFPNTPVIFCGLNFFEDAWIAGREDTFTGVVEATDTQATLDLALKLHPNTRRIIVINDATTTGKIHSDLLRQAMPRYTDRVEFVFYEDPDLAELLPAIRNLPEDTLIFLILLNRDRAGQFYTYEQAGDLIFANTNRPIYGLWDFYLGHGMVGGKLANSFSQGEAAGKMALEILSGKQVRDIPILRESPNRYIFDYRLLQKFNIRASLPPDAQVINRPPSLYEQYAGVIWPAAAIIAALVVVIAIQLANLRQRRQVEAELRLSNLELQNIRASLEETVAERTRDLERRSAYLEASAEVGRAAVSILDTDQLIQQAVELVRARFGLYNVGLFLVDDSGQWAELRASAGQAAQTLMDRGLRLALDHHSMTGWCITEGQARVAQQADQDAVRLALAEFPEARSEAALPLKARGQVIGALNVQSTQPEFFDPDTLAALSTMADQVAIAIDNARLFAAAQQAIEAERKAYGEIQGRAWAQLLQARPLWGYQSDASGTRPVTQPAPRPEAGLPALKLPIKARDQVLGVIEAHKDQDAGEWTSEEIALAQTLSEQLGIALDSARLYQETQQRAAREQMARQITDRLRGAADMNNLLQTTLREIVTAFGVPGAFVQLAPEQTDHED